MERKPFTNKNIINELRKNSSILKKYKVRKIGLFGSYMGGEQKNRSDVDILVEFDDKAFGKNLDGYFDNYIELLSSLRKIFGRKTDLLTFEMISPYIKPHVLKEIEYVEGY
jgi:predicted nucleotidyltransferase